jgi:hypothetical protein
MSYLKRVCNKISSFSNLILCLTLCSQLLIGCATAQKNDIQPFADIFRSAVSVYAGAPLMDDQQQKEFNRKLEENKANQIANMPTGTKILEQNRQLTQVQRTDYDKSNLRREIRIQGSLVDVVATNHLLTATSTRHHSGNSLVVVQLDAFGRAYVNIPKQSLWHYQHKVKGEAIEIFCTYASSSERHVSCNTNF